MVVPEEGAEADNLQVSAENGIQDSFVILFWRNNLLFIIHTRLLVLFEDDWFEDNLSLSLAVILFSR